MTITRRRKRLLGASLVAGVLATLPPVQARGKAVAVLTEAVGVPFPRPFAARVTLTETTLDGITGDLYDAGRSAPALLLLPGAARKGRQDRRVQQVSRALARAGRTVFVPDLELTRTTFDPVDIDRIVRAVVALHSRSPDAGRVAILGFSYGGSFALLAAADRRTHGHLATVVTFGSYFDLVGVIQGATTGRSTVEGVSHAWQAHPEAGRIVREVALRLVPPGETEALRGVFAGAAGADSLPPAARAAYDLVTNTDPDRTARLAGLVAPEARQLLADFSPSAVAGAITVPVVALHSVDDPLVPHAELLRLRVGLSGARTMTVRSFEHVDLRGGSGVDLVRDLVTAWRFTAALLSAQE